MSKQSLNQAIVLARTDGTSISRGLNGLVGKPVGGWPETRQAKDQLVDALPLRSQRDYSVDELIAATLQEVGADERGCGHWAWM